MSSSGDTFKPSPTTPIAIKRARDPSQVQKQRNRYYSIRDASSPLVEANTTTTTTTTTTTITTTNPPSSPVNTTPLASSPVYQHPATPRPHHSPSKSLSRIQSEPAMNNGPTASEVARQRSSSKFSQAAGAMVNKLRKSKEMVSTNVVFATSDTQGTKVTPIVIKGGDPDRKSKRIMSKLDLNKAKGTILTPRKESITSTEVFSTMSDVTAQMAPISTPDASGKYYYTTEDFSCWATYACLEDDENIVQEYFTSTTTILKSLYKKYDKEVDLERESIQETHLLTLVETRCNKILRLTRIKDMDQRVRLRTQDLFLRQRKEQKLGQGRLGRLPCKLVFPIWKVKLHVYSRSRFCNKRE